MQNHLRCFLVIAVAWGVSANPGYADEITLSGAANSDITATLQAAIDAVPNGGERTINIGTGTFYLSRTVVFPPNKKIHLTGIEERNSNGALPTELKVEANTWDVAVNSQSPVHRGKSTIIFAMLGNNSSLQFFRLNGNNVDFRNANPPDVRPKRLTDPSVEDELDYGERAAKDAQIGVLVSGANNCTLNGLDIINVGKSRYFPGGSHILLCATDAADAPVGLVNKDITRSGTEYDLRNPGNDCNGNTISNCILMDVIDYVSNDNRFIPLPDDRTVDLKDPDSRLWDVQASFGIRVLTRWQENAYPEVSARSNKIFDNHLAGFYWNAIEIGGPKTKHTNVHDNTVLIGFQTGIESDKGAKDNTFTDNIVEALYSHLRLKRIWVYQSLANGEADEVGKAHPKTTAYAYRDQGFFNDQNTADTSDDVTQFANNNTFLRNKVFRLEGYSVGKTGVFKLSRSKGVSIKRTVLKTAPLDKSKGMIVLDGDDVDRDFYYIFWEEFVDGDDDDVKKSRNTVPGKGRSETKRRDIEFIDKRY